MFRWFRLTAIFPLAFLSILMVVVLGYTMVAMGSATLYNTWYSTLLVLGVIGFLLLFALMSYYIVLLYKGVKARLAGAKLIASLVGFFVVLSLLPLLLLFGFSITVIDKSIDSWFDESLDKGFTSALDLTQIVLDIKLKDAQTLTQNVASSLRGASNERIIENVQNLRTSLNAKDITFLDRENQLITFSNQNKPRVLPDMPNNLILTSVRNGIEYVNLEPITDSLLQVRVVTLFKDHSDRILQAIYEIPEQYSLLAESTQSATVKYRQYKSLRGPLKFSFTILLTMVLILAILLAFGGAFFAARRVVAPIKDLSDATKAIADGNYDQNIPSSAKGELGFLVDSFNEMSQRLSIARTTEKNFQQLLQSQSEYLAAVLERLSSGVIVIGLNGVIRMWNTAACNILQVKDYELELLDLFTCADVDVDENTIKNKLHDFSKIIQSALESSQGHGDSSEEWRRELIRFSEGKRQILSLRGAKQKDQMGLKGGHIIVFDDITHLITSEREAAWGEVARRLAHEIKNPLTPIQLSAERIRMKLMAKLDEKDAKLIDKSTQTIISQVSAMKEMVDAFSQYARPPKLNLGKIDLNFLINDVIYLYRDYPSGIELQLNLDHKGAYVLGDEVRLRQLLHNLIKNALEACAEEGGLLEIETQTNLEKNEIKLIIRDDGIGFDSEIMNHMYEPYVTTKSKGTGLGLSIVKKIVEEHEGVISIQSEKGLGATISILMSCFNDQEEPFMST